MKNLGDSCRVAILGTGYIAEFHLKALRLQPNVDVVAVCDLSRNRAEQFAGANRIPNIYTDLATMLRQENLDVVHVLTPPNIHAINAPQILDAGVNTFIEKPLCHTLQACQDVRHKAEANDCLIGVSHNFLFDPAHEQLTADWRSGRLGQIDQVDIVWNKELGQVSGGPYNVWMLQSPTNILFEVAPHLFVHLLYLLGEEPDSLHVEVRDRVELPRGLEFYRRWEIQGWKGNTSIRIRLSFIDGYPEHYINVRGTNAVAKADLENNTYVCQEHIPQSIDLDRYANIVVPAWGAFRQANQNLGRFIFSKLKLNQSPGGPFAESIAGAVSSFYSEPTTRNIDHRISSALGEASVAFAERVARESGLLDAQPLIHQDPPPETVKVSELPEKGTTPSANVLVIGGTGFIGRDLVRTLVEKGYGVRVMARDPRSCPPELKALNIELVQGDFTKANTVEKALEGIDYVYHLARGVGDTWDEYLKFDVEPTRKVAELCLKAGVKRLFYTSSSAIYDAGNPSKPITESTKPCQGVMRVNPYARSKVENERVLRQLHQEKGLPVVIFRPAIVVGHGGNPYHWGVAGWPYTSVCRLWGDGNDKLPMILVRDLSEAMARAIEVSDIDGDSFNLSGPPLITANEYLDEFEREAGLQLKRVPTSGMRYYSEAFGKWMIKAAGRDPKAAFPSYADGQGRSFASLFDSAKAQRELDWSPVRDRETLIAEGIHVPVREFFS